MWKLLIRNVKHGRRVMQNAGQRILHDIGEIISQEYRPNGTPFDTEGTHNLLLFYCSDAGYSSLTCSMPFSFFSCNAKHLIRYFFRFQSSIVLNQLTCYVRSFLDYNANFANASPHANSTCEHGAARRRFCASN